MLNIQENISLADHTTFRIGGPAKYFTEVVSVEELKEALRYARENQLEFFILGGGSNVLADDRGFAGLVIKMKLNGIKIEGEKMEVAAGVPLAKAISESIKQSLDGLEWAAGVPGTMGGAVRGNAGAFGGEIGNVVESVKVLDVDTLETGVYEAEKCEFGYRRSIFKQNRNLIILLATLKLTAGNAEESRKKTREIIAQRIAKQPKGAASAGSFFINPVVDNDKLIQEFEAEKGVQSKDRKVPAGWLIDRAEMRGKKLGGAMVSDIHPNYIINAGRATAEDVVMLASLVKQQVRDKLGVQLYEEVQHLGF